MLYVELVLFLGTCCLFSASPFFAPQLHHLQVDKNLSLHFSKIRKMRRTSCERKVNLLRNMLITKRFSFCGRLSGLGAIYASGTDALVYTLAKGVSERYKTPASLGNRQTGQAISDKQVYVSCEDEWQAQVLEAGDHCSDRCRNSKARETKMPKDRSLGTSTSLQSQSLLRKLEPRGICCTNTLANSVAVTHYSTGCYTRKCVVIGVVRIVSHADILLCTTV